MKSTKKHSRFIQEGKLRSAESASSFSHSVGKMKKVLPADLKDADAKDIPQKYKNLWFMKHMENSKIAVREVVAQEFFRLLIPGHPKTRLVFEEKGYNIYVASKAIPGFRDIGSIGYQAFNAGIKKGTFTGLGDITTISLLLNEIDLKNGNIGINAQGQVIKIDGDWCFARLSSDFASHNYKITENTIKHLPFPDTYYAWNWLDAIEAGVAIPSTKMIDAQTSLNPKFRMEVNNALLRALILPDDLIKNFVKTYAIEPRYAAKLSDEIIERKQQMEKAALANTDFQIYIKSNAAKEHLEEYLKYLREFNTTSKNKILKTLPSAENLIMEKFANLRGTIQIDLKEESEVDAAPITVGKGALESKLPATIEIAQVAQKDLKVESEVDAAPQPVITKSIPAKNLKIEDKVDAADPTAITTAEPSAAQDHKKILGKPTVTTVPVIIHKQSLPITRPISVAKVKNTAWETKNVAHEVKTQPAPKTSSFLGTPTKKGAFGGFIVGLLGAVAFIALRALDVVTLGLSLPATIPLSIVVLGAVGTMAGAGIGRAVQNHGKTNRIQPESFTAASENILTVSDQKLERNVQARTGQLYAATKKQKVYNTSRLEDEKQSSLLGIVPAETVKSSNTNRKRGRL